MKNKESPKPWDVRQLFPGWSGKEIGEKVAEYFNRITNKFTPLKKEETPVGRPGHVEKVEEYQVAGP